MDGRQSIRSLVIAEADRQGLTAHAIAVKAGIDPGIVSRFMTGRRDITVAKLEAIAEVLGLEVRRKRNGS